jgi:hypothetical protein
MLTVATETYSGAIETDDNKIFYEILSSLQQFTAVIYSHKLGFCIGNKYSESDVDYKSYTLTYTITLSKR